MKKYYNIFSIYILFAQFHSFCDGGLMDLLLSRRHHMFNENNNPMAPVIQNYPGNNYNWRLPEALLKDRDRINNGNSYNGRTNDDNNNFSDNPLLNNQGVPFTNGNNFNNRLPNAFLTNGDGDLNSKPTNIDVDTNGNTPISNTFQNNANLPKIMNDINKINHIMDAIKKQNAANNRRKQNDGNYQNSNGYNNDSPTEPGGFANTYNGVHINKGPGVLTNVNSNGYQNGGNSQVSSPFISNKPHYNVPPLKIPNNNDYNTATSNPVITNPPTDTPMTNVSPSGNGLNNYNGNIHRTKPIISHPPSNGRRNTAVKFPNSSSSNTRNEKPKQDDKYLLKPIMKTKFFFQVKPVVPDYKTVSHSETIYYVN
ncbi:unnamed protein product [Colias eurytheme]|nr:unnamed protein product [Colias eurytheme]